MHSLFTGLCKHPIFYLEGFTKPFHSESDASNNAVGSVSTQEYAYFHKPIALLSKTFTSCERNYSVYDYKLFVISTYCKA